VGRLAMSFEDYLFKNKPQTGVANFLGELDINAQLRALNSSYWVSPYLNVGIGTSFFRKSFGVYAPLGVGLQVNLGNDAYIDLGTQIRMDLTKNTTKHFFHSLGVVANLGKKTKKEQPVAPPVVVTPPQPVDTDKDGIADADDACPTVAGKTSLKGCPDKDNDGIADANDNCPEKFGTEKYKGCPVPDSDGDGVNDEDDKCPTEKGMAKYSGCPMSDKDKDGVADEEDRCPDVPGIVSEQGCPPVEKETKEAIQLAAKNIYFATGSDKILASSNKALTEVTKILKNDEALNLSIEGHTDNVGDADRNQALSERRAEAVKAYLVAKGIDESRLSAKGFGDSQPDGDNTTAAGRNKNRRVVLNLSY
jgi:OmpA-OmpF porin, OOP family